MTKVKCSVTNCYYNKKGEICEAEEIKVRQSLTGTDMEIGSIETRSSEGTVCETFRSKGENKKTTTLFS